MHSVTKLEVSESICWVFGIGKRYLKLSKVAYKAHWFKFTCIQSPRAQRLLDNLKKHCVTHGGRDFSE